MIATVRNILKEKDDQVWSVQPDTPLIEAVVLMAEKKIGFVPVIQEKKILGVFSERDFARLMVARHDLPLDTPVGDVMVSPVYFVHPDQTVEECMAVMSAKHFRHLPVMQDECCIGVISIGDVVKRMVLEKDIAIENLENLLWANLV
jgi:CBS domain-containing protein